MLRIINLEEIQQKLLCVAELADEHERRASDFAENVKVWLADVENTLKNNRMSAAGNIAAMRAVVISAQRGVMPPGVQIHGRLTARKITSAAGAMVLQQASDLLAQLIERDQQRIEDARNTTRQMLSLAKARGIDVSLPRNGDFTGAIKALWRMLRSDPELTAGTINIEGLVGPHDALMLLDRVIAIDNGQS